MLPVHVTSQWFESVKPPSALALVPVNGRSATTAYRRKLVPSAAFRHGDAGKLPMRRFGSSGSGGDGIMSVIDFDMTIERQPDPKGDRVKLTLSGKFLPYKEY